VVCVDGDGDPGAECHLIKRSWTDLAESSQEWSLVIRYAAWRNLGVGGASDRLAVVAVAVVLRTSMP